MKRFFKHKTTLFLVFFGLLFFYLYSHFNLAVFQPQDIFQAGQLIKFNSPDETANYFWTQRLAQGKSLYYFEPLNLPATNLIHLRSLNTVGGKITPGSFLGLPLIYGFLARLFGLAIVPYLTPLFSVLAIIFFYLLIQRLFKDKILALLSALLLSFFPAWFYYSARGMYHNILFISLFIIGLYLLLTVLNISLERNYFKINIKKLNINLKFKIYNLKFFLYFLAGLVIGLSVITRTSEIVWLFFTVLLVFVFNFKKIYWPGFILFLGGLWLPLLVLFYYNYILYGSYISAGYRSVIPGGDIVRAAASGLLFKILITPFGFNLKSILINAYHYLFRFLLNWSLPALIGALLFASLPKKFFNGLAYKYRWRYLLYAIALGIYLSVFYGAWQFSDRIDGQLVSLGSSYLRYWLPIYIISLPWIAALIIFFARLVVPQINPRWLYYRYALILAFLVVLFIPSFNLTVRATDESLFFSTELSRLRVKSKIITGLTKADDVIITYKQADKIFFPQRRKIITALVVPADYQALARLAKLTRLYYYTFAPPATVDFISRHYFEPYGLELINGRRVLGQDWLYQFRLKKN